MTPAVRELVSRALAEKYRSAAYCFVYGSAATGASRPHSDIDLLVVYDTTITPFREKYRFEGVLMDVFCYDEESLNGELHMARNHGYFVKINAVLLSETLPAPSAGSLRIQEVARRIKNAGYLQRNSSNRRQYATNIIDDLADCVSASERTMLCVELFKWIAETVVMCNGGGLTNRKHCARQLSGAEPALHARLDLALAQSLQGQIGALVAIATDVLERVGGPQRDGIRFNIPNLTRMPLPVL